MTLYGRQELVPRLRLDGLDAYHAGRTDLASLEQAGQSYNDTTIKDLSYSGFVEGWGGELSFFDGVLCAVV